MYLPNDKSRTLVNRSSSGSLAKFAAMRRASSLVSRLVAERRTPTICPELILWAAPPPARECHGYGRR